MSMGYIPKKRLYLKRQRKLRKKYKNFSCETCAKTHDDEYYGYLCSHRYELTRPFGMTVYNVQNCKHWKASKQKTLPSYPDKPKLSTKIKDFLENIF